MRYWDASAIVPLLLEEPATKRVMSWLTKDPEIMTWWGTDVECASAIARLEREQTQKGGALTRAFRRLEEFSEAWIEVQPSEMVRHSAIRILRVHPVRAADALQLAAALAAAEQRPSSLQFVSLDERLTAVAEREGFSVLR
jgi:predicted nucleic acid-binding protein